MLHKVKKILGPERTLEKTIPLLTLFAGIMGTNLGTPLAPSVLTLISLTPLKCIISLLREYCLVWMLVSMDFYKCWSLSHVHVSKNDVLGYRYTLNTWGEITESALSKITPTAHWIPHIKRYGACLELSITIHSVPMVGFKNIIFCVVFTTSRWPEYTFCDFLIIKRTFCEFI